ncbi:hypothetical protein EV356DRAFT_511271 [Viridothelium virens]|uniref:MARVEL domain-containing protein n=1 Tax=Viridothelium virens TaxID=1048519 RepID=A0A6A6HPL5_VIRVR|nr:hypothetical protein EV356DRAFT_511271 [Viridothelium virens]
MSTSDPTSAPPPTTNPTILTSGLLLRTLFLLEAALNLSMGFVLLVHPTSTLASLIAHPHITTTSTASLAQWLGALVLGLVPPLLQAVPNGPGQVARRRWVYGAFAWVELVLIAVWAWQVGAVGERRSGLETGKMLSTALGPVAVTLGWRVWVLGWRGEWFGLEEEEGKGGRQREEKKRQ